MRVKASFLSRAMNKLIQYPIISDKFAVKRRYEIVLGEKLDLSSPLTFNQKIQWLKLYDHNPEYCILVDKYRAKEWLSVRVGGQYIPKTLAVWENVEKISIDGLPDRFVIKTNHDSGGVLICHDKHSFNLTLAKRILRSHLKKNYYYISREWPYKNVRPLIIAEEYLGSDSQRSLADYKIFCFSNGRLITLLCEDRFAESGLKETFFDESWHPLDVTEGGCKSNPTASCPRNFEEMKILARKISEGRPFMRVDFFESMGRLYVGEITLHPKSGLERFVPDNWDYLFGSWIDLSLAYKGIEK